MYSSGEIPLPNRHAPWLPDLGNGEYQNPILFADYSDPDVIRHGEKYYLISSSFTHTPGLPILHSRDLVNWRILNHAVKNVPGERYNIFQPGCGVWAPAIRHHDGKFWIFFPTPDEGIYHVVADHPAGEWSQPHLVHAAQGWIDPCPLWDDDGRAWIVFAYAASRAGINSRLAVVEMAPDGSRLLGEPVVVFHNPELHHTIEGPKFLKKDGWYYILAPAGGVADGWQVALRSRNILGPYEDRIVLHRGNTDVNGPHQGALVDTVGGEWWFVHFQERAPHGRILHLQPAHWQDGWPQMGVDQNGDGIGEPVTRYRKPFDTAATQPSAPQTSDEFGDSVLSRQWQWQANHTDAWYSLTARPGWLRMFAQPGAVESAPHLLLQKLSAPSIVAETLVDAGSLSPNDSAGLIIAGGGHAALVIARGKTADEIKLLFDAEVVFRTSVQFSPIQLRAHMDRDGTCHFAFGASGHEMHGITLTWKATLGKWVGAKVGIFVSGTHAADHTSFADFDYFHIEAFA